MKTSRRKYNQQYRSQHLYINGFHAPTIVSTCNEHVRCEECGSHVKLTGFRGCPDGWILVYECPTCGKSYGVIKYVDEEAEDAPA